MLELQQGGNTAALGTLEQHNWSSFTVLDIELVVFLTAKLLAAGLAEVASLLRCRPGHEASLLVSLHGRIAAGGHIAMTNGLVLLG